MSDKDSIKLKLENAFDTFDVDANGKLDINEIGQCLETMLKVLGADKKKYNIEKLKMEFIKQLDEDNNKELTRQEFVGKYSLIF